MPYSSIYLLINDPNILANVISFSSNLPSLENIINDPTGSPVEIIGIT